MSDPNCAFCDGTGWREVKRGEVSGVERCQCNQLRGPARLLEAARIPARFENASFENFILPRDNPHANQALGNAMVEARGFAREYPFTDRTGLLFMGSPGVGK